MVSCTPLLVASDTVGEFSVLQAAIESIANINNVGFYRVSGVNHTNRALLIKRLLMKELLLKEF